MTASFLILGILPFMHQEVFPSPIVIFTLLAILTKICHLWTVATSWERYTFTSICHLSESQWRPQMSPLLLHHVETRCCVPTIWFCLTSKQVTCAENQHHVLYRLAKCTNLWTTNTMPRQTFGKCTPLQILNKQYGSGICIKIIHFPPCTTIKYWRTCKMNQSWEWG